MVALTTAMPRKLGVSFAILVIGQVIGLAAIGLAAIGLAAIGLAAHPAHSAPASAPSDRIAVLYNVLTQTMQQAKQLGVNGRFDQLAPVLSQTYDVPSMSRMAVGQSWDTLTPQVQSGIIEAFTRMMVANYASQFDGFSGERFEILQTIDRGPTDKLVKTQLVQGNGKAVELDYLMRSTGGDWKVVDVYLDGSISEIASRRAEFSSILKSGGPEALIASLRKQGDKLLARSS